MKSELHLDYDDKMHAIGATCSACGERMPKPDPELKDNAERIEWFSRQYVEHNKQKHSQEDRRRMARE